MTFTLYDHIMKPPSVLYNFRSVPLVTGINKPRSETHLFLEQKAANLIFNLYHLFFKPKCWHMCRNNLIRFRYKN